MVVTGAGETLRLEGAPWGQRLHGGVFSPAQESEQFHHFWGLVGPPEVSPWVFGLWITCSFPRIAR